jgi:hypothetical protein
VSDLTFTFHLDPAEQVRATQAVTRRQRFSWLWRWGWIVFLLPVVLALATDVPLRTLWPYAVILSIIAIWSALVPVLMRRQIRRTISATPSLREPQTYHFAPEALRMTNPLAAAELRWDAVLEAAETSEFILLYYSPKCAYYVPKRIVGSRLAELREFLRSMMGSRAAALPVVEGTSQVA